MTPYKTKNRKYFFAFIILLLLTSCSANIESTSANSISAILAVCGEYILAGFSLIILLLILLLIHCMRITGVVISVISVYLLYNDIKIGQLDSILLLLIGLILVGISFLPPVKYHEPNVVIAKNVVKPKNIELKNDSQRHVIFEIIVGVLIGIILMIIEQNSDFAFIK